MKISWTLKKISPSPKEWASRTTSLRWIDLVVRGVNCEAHGYQRDGKRTEPITLSLCALSNNKINKFTSV